MGAGASAPRPPPEPTAGDLTVLGAPYSKSEDNFYFFTLPADEEWKKKAEQLLLEVSSLGFRLMRPGSEDVLFLYPWGQIHSWSNSDIKFTFRYYDDGRKAMVQYSLYLRDMRNLLAHIQQIIEKILNERKSMAVTPERFEALLEALRTAAARGNPLLDVLQAHSHNTYYWAEQGRQVLDCLPTSFDKVEAAVVLHGKLIDQNRFSFMLEGLESQMDKDNVWHRITLNKKSTSKKHG